MSAGDESKLRIAVAEDEPDTRRLLVRILECLGHDVTYAASNGADLVKHCLDQRVDVVLVDLDMPIMDGLTAAELLAAKGIPVVLISGHPDADHVVVEHEPVVTRLTKPASLDSLKNAIEQALTMNRKPHGHRP